MQYLLKDYNNPYEFFLNLGKFYKSNGVEKRGISANKQCDMLFEFATIYFAKNFDKNKKLIFLNELERLINLDFAQSGNTRKWRRHI